MSSNKRFNTEQKRVMIYGNLHVYRAFLSG